MQLVLFMTEKNLILPIQKKIILKTYLVKSLLKNIIPQEWSNIWDGPELPNSYLKSLGKKIKGMSNYLKNVNEIVSAKETLKYLLENGKNLDDLNDNIKANHFQYDLDPLYMLKIKNMKLPKYLKDKNIQNKTNNKNKKIIKIKRKIKFNRSVML